MACSHFKRGICDIIKKNPSMIGIRCGYLTCSRFNSEKEEEKVSWKPEYGQTRKTKTHTSTAVKAKYNKKHYEQLSIVVPIGSRELIQRKAIEEGYGSTSEYIRHLIIADAPECITFQDNGGEGAITIKDIYERFEVLYGKQ
jgi:hypothetical protein